MIYTRHHKQARRPHDRAARRWMPVMMSLCVALLMACGARRSEPPPGPSLEEIRAAALNADQRSWLLRSLEGEALRAMNQWMYLIDLHAAEGNEMNPRRLIDRFDRELADPVVMKEEHVKALSDEMKQALLMLSDGNYDDGHEVVRHIIAPILLKLPSDEECMRRLTSSNTDRVVAVFLVNEYFQKDHYHHYNLSDKIFRLLTSTSKYRRWALPVVEASLRSSHYRSYEHNDAVEAARPIVGPHFDAWYKDIRGASPGWEAFNDWMPWAW